MAIDEAITMAIAEGLAPPTLRFYAWAPPCVSMGRNQKSAEVDAARCAARGYGIVRRPTGGRAILHTDELTYSLIAAPDHPLMAGLVLDSYLRLSAGLVAGLTRLGIAAEPAPGHQPSGSGRLGRVLRGAVGVRDRRGDAQGAGQRPGPPRPLGAAARLAAADGRPDPRGGLPDVRGRSRA